MARPKSSFSKRAYLRHRLVGEVTSTESCGRPPISVTVAMMAVHRTFYYQRQRPASFNLHQLWSKVFTRIMPVLYQKVGLLLRANRAVYRPSLTTGKPEMIVRRAGAFRRGARSHRSGAQRHSRY